MSNNTQTNPVIAPPLLIGICILGAVVAVIVTAALYKLCRRATVDTTGHGDGGDKSWNPNQRNLEQTRYMEEVRMRNKMFAWERSRAGKVERVEQGVEWVEKMYNAREVSEEEYLEDISLQDNPYEDVVDECVRRQVHHISKRSPTKFHRPFRDEVAQRRSGFALPEAAVRLDGDMGQNTDSKVKIMVNDGTGDIVEGNEPLASTWAPRRSRMFRSSSIYSGDVLLPSTHLHLVQSSSSYAFGKNNNLNA